MLSEQERRELLDMARSAAVREEFRQLEAARTTHPVDLDTYVRFLTSMSRFTTPPPLRSFVPYTRVLL